MLVKFTTMSNARTVYVNPEWVVMVRPLNESATTIVVGLVVGDNKGYETLTVEGNVDTTASKLSGG